MQTKKLGVQAAKVMMLTKSGMISDATALATENETDLLMVIAMKSFYMFELKY